MRIFPGLNTSLKARFMLAIVVVVSASSFLFALALITIKDRLEEATFGEMVRDQLEVILETDRPFGDIALLNDWRFYDANNSETLNEIIRSLPLGSHHSVQADGRYYQVEVAQSDNRRVYLTYDITEWEEQEHAVLRLLGYGMAGVLLIAIGLAWLATRAGLRPLDELTRRLAAINPDDREIQIAAEFEGHEVGSIAREFDRYLHRLDEFVDRERFFSAAASHELRTPLSVIIGAVDVIEAKQTDSGSSRALQRIRRACVEMLAFIEATLFLSREDYQFNEQHSEYDVSDLVRESLQENDSLIQERDIRISYEPPQPLVLEEPPSVVKMVISNILKNALEHTWQGQVSISQDAQTLSITDNGEGIAEADIDRVFERNYTTKSCGTGLGLTLVRKICDRLNWQIDIQSQAGKGTTVTVRFRDGQSSPGRQ